MKFYFRKDEYYDYEEISLEELDKLRKSYRYDLEVIVLVKITPTALYFERAVYEC